MACEGWFWFWRYNQNRVFLVTAAKKSRPRGTSRALGVFRPNPRLIRFENSAMATSNPIDVQFSREDLRRRGIRDRMHNLPITDDLFDSLLAKLRSTSLQATAPTRRRPSLGGISRQSSKG